MPVDIHPDVTGMAPHVAHDITIRNVNATTIDVGGAHNVTISGGQIGPFRSCLFSSDQGMPDQCQQQGMLMGEDGADFGAQIIDGVTYDMSHLTLQGIYTHDMSKPWPGTPRLQRESASCLAHTDCWQFGSGQHVTIRDNIFMRCSDSDLFTGYQAGSGVADWLVEDNFLGMIKPPSGVAYYNFQISSSGAGIERAPESDSRQHPRRHRVLGELQSEGPATRACSPRTCCRRLHQRLRLVRLELVAQSLLRAGGRRAATRARR